MLTIIDTILRSNRELYVRWERCITLPNTEPASWRKANLFAEIVLRYSEVHRHYHALNHIKHCLGTFDFVKESIPAHLHFLIQIALIYHDVVYDPEREDNEIRSGEIARNHLMELGWRDQNILQIINSIRATAHTGTPLTAEVAKWVVDIDLSSLAARPEVFDKNTLDIKAEYEHCINFTERKWQEGRRAFAQKMLGRAEIFHTEPFFRAYEEEARRNLARTIESLAPIPAG